MYTAFELVKLLDLSAKATALAAAGDKLYVGNGTGDVELYTIRENESPLEPTVERIEAVNMEVGKRPIEKLVVVPSLNHLVVLVDGRVLIRDAANLGLVMVLNDLRGTSAMCLRTHHTGRPALCFAVKRQLMLSEFTDDQYKVVRELFIPDIAYDVSWADDMLCVGFKREYSLVNSETGEVSDLVEAMREIPLVRHVSEDSFLMVHEKTGVWIDCEGHEPKPIGELSWATNPYGLVFHYPFALCLLNDGIDIRCIQLESIQQTIELDKGKHALLVESHGKILLHHAGRVSLLRPVPTDQQVNQLLALNRVQEALNLLDNTAEGASSRKKGVPPAETEFLVSDRGLQLLVSRCADVVSHTGPFLQRSFVPDLLSAELISSVFINHFLQFLSEQCGKADQIVTACLAHLRDPSIKSSRLLSLLVLISQTVLRSTGLSPEVAQAALQMVRKFYLWPSPYGDCARNVLKVLRDDNKTPGSGCQARQLSHFESAHVFYDVKSQPAEIWRHLWHQPPITMQDILSVYEPLGGVIQDQLSGPVTNDSVVSALVDSDSLMITTTGVEESAAADSVQPAAASPPATPSLAPPSSPKLTPSSPKLTPLAEPPTEPPSDEVTVRLAPFCEEQVSVLDFKLNLHEVRPSSEDRDLVKRQYLSETGRIVHSTSYDALQTAVQDAGSNKELKLVVAGADEVLHSALCAFVACHHTEPKQTAALDIRWYLVPLAQDNELAMFLGHYDGWYSRHMLFAYQSTIALVGADRGIESYGRQDGILNALTGTRRPEDPCTAVQTPVVSPATVIRRCLQTYLNEAQEILSVPIYQCEMYTLQSNRQYWTVPFFRRLDIGILAYAQSFKVSQGIPIDIPLEKVESEKKFKFEMPKLRAKWTRCTLLGATEEPISDTHVFRSLAIVNMPSPDAPHVTPQAPYLLATYQERLGSSRRKSVSFVKSQPESTVTLANVALESDSDRGFDILVDGVLYGPVKKIIVEPCMLPGTKTQLQMRVATFFPVEF
eukprot:TRINITY_DN565_c0_g1_i1.p1 TRINITY_DN565_c0_g1~~TRINITY_DN565_c0_g1_i1.p1  ORF type:complete len:1003 (-),score=175.07 TRINITY_DN565_c0_g1_i1:1176-4184(-)